MKTLPDKPSELIELALRDLNLIEKDKNYVVDMVEWHNPWEYKNICCVCLAGSIMAKTLKVSKNNFYVPYYFSYDTASKLLAINAFRVGEISHALDKLNYNLHDLDQNIKVNIIPYKENPKQFKRDMKKMAKTFRSLGL